MTRVRIALGILAALILLSAGAVFTVKINCGHVMSTLEQLRHAEEKGDTAEALTLCETAQKRWKEAQGILKLCVSYERLAEAENIICRLKPLLEEDCDEFTAELAQAQTVLKNITDGETPYFTNVF
jgi:hypothetical protein